MRAGGAGFKCLKVIKNENDVESLLFIDAKTSKWDSCAGEAIIRAMGGYSIKPSLSDIDYRIDLPYENKEGFLFTLNEETFRKFIEILSKE